jgi:hypothetical protein
MDFDFSKFRSWLLSNDKITSEQLTETINLFNDYIEYELNKSGYVYIDRLFDKKYDTGVINYSLRYNITSGMFGSLLNCKLQFLGQVGLIKDKPIYCIQSIDLDNVEDNYFYYSEEEYNLDVKTLSKLYK